MSLNPETMSRLQDLIRQDTSLRQRLQEAANVEEAADVLAAAAAAHGIPVERDAFIAHAGEAAALEDTQLDAVAGGTEAKFAPYTIPGIGCR